MPSITCTAPNLPVGCTPLPTGATLVPQLPLGPALLPNQRAKDKHVIYSRNGTGTSRP